MADPLVMKTASGSPAVDDQCGDRSRINLGTTSFPSFTALKRIGRRSPQPRGAPPIRSKRL